MPSYARSRLVERLLETLSLAEHFNEQNPPSPITRAALHNSLRDLIAELETITVEPSPNDPAGKNVRQ